MLELLNICFSSLCRTTHADAEGKHPIVLRIFIDPKEKTSLPHSLFEKGLGLPVRPTEER